MLNRIVVLAAFPLTACLAAVPALAEPALGPLFGDHAVLQRDRPISVWGTAGPGEAVTVTLGDAARSVRADRAGNWRAELPAMKAGGPYRLVATGAGGASAMADDVLIGDVWLCSGQSNMELSVSPFARRRHGRAGPARSAAAAVHRPAQGGRSAAG